jgi:uncharacterized membrane protein YfcA
VPIFVVFALVSLGAQLVDGSLGMGYGVTTTTVLLALGTSPVAASATIHFAEIGTTFASGLSHWRFGNVDWKVVAKIGLPGAVGAFCGAHLLSSISASLSRPVMAVVLTALGCYLLASFTFRGFDRRNLGKPVRAGFLLPLGLVGGFVNAIGGGGWGPIGTPAILSSGRMEPRRVVGSVDTSKFLVAAAGSLGFLSVLGAHGVDLPRVAGLLVGGIVAAPFAAWLVRHLAPRLLGALVGGMLVLTNVRTLLGADGFDAPGAVRTAVYVVVCLVWAAAVVHSWRQHRRERAAEPAPATGQAPAPTAEADLAAEANLAVEADRAVERPVAAGRPSDPRD